MFKKIKERIEGYHGKTYEKDMIEMLEQTDEYWKNEKEENE